MEHGKIYDLNTQRGIYEMMIDHRKNFQKANGMDADSPYARLQEAKDKMLLDYYDRLDKEAAARQRAKEDAELEEEAAENYTISFSYNVKGGSK